MDGILKYSTSTVRTRSSTVLCTVLYIPRGGWVLRRPTMDWNMEGTIVDWIMEWTIVERTIVGWIMIAWIVELAKMEWIMERSIDIEGEFQRGRFWMFWRGTGWQEGTMLRTKCLIAIVSVHYRTEPRWPSSIDSHQSNPFFLCWTKVSWTERSSNFLWTESRPSFPDCTQTSSSIWTKAWSSSFKSPPIHVKFVQLCLGMYRPIKRFILIIKKKTWEFSQAAQECLRDHLWKMRRHFTKFMMLNKMVR